MTLPAGALSFYGSLTEEQMMEFISLPNPEGAGKFDGVIVSRDGKITYLDEPIVIDYKERSIITPGSLAVKRRGRAAAVRKGRGADPVRTRNAGTAWRTSIIKNRTIPRGRP